MIIYISYLIIIISLSIFFKKKKLFTNYKQYSHQKLVNDSVPLVGGFFLLIPIFYIFYDNFFLFTLVSFAIFLIGCLSDFQFLSSPKRRLILQTLIVTFFIINIKLEVLPSRIDFLDEAFQNTYWSYFFTVFCLMILINGSNFVDGLNGLFLGYSLIIIFVIYKLNFFSSIEIQLDDFIFLFYIFFFVFLLNIFNYLFLGDSGAYLVGFFLGYVLIEIYNLNKQISPYFIILLLWYPCFENLFSILRKKLLKKLITKPDNNHLHQLLFIFFKKKNKSSQFANIFSSILINLFNLIIILIGTQYPGQSLLQIILITISISTYMITYLILKKLN